MSKLLFDPEGKLRSGWRFALFLLSFLFISSIMQAIFVNLLREEISNNLNLIVFLHALSAMISILMGWFFGSLLENLPFRALGISFTKNWFRDFLFGILFGFFSLFLAVSITYTLGALKFEIKEVVSAKSTLITLSKNFLIFLVASISEETLFRGYMLQTFLRSKSPLIGITLTSALFAYAHNLNPNVSFLSLLNTFIAGIWLSIAYLKTQNLWFPTAIHMSWNWFQGTIFGINVSGIREFSENSLLKVIERKHDLLSGGEYGIEGGIACTVSLLVSTALLLFLPPKINIKLFEARPE